MQAYIKGTAFHLPDQILDNTELALELGTWTPEKIEAKTGIRQRHIAQGGELPSDLAVAAALNLFKQENVVPSDIDYLLFCTQGPDYLLPTTACLLQTRLGLKKNCGALDFNLGCSGFIYGLGLAKGLIESGQAHNVLLLTADTYSKFIHPQDRSVRTLFGDAAAATLICGEESDRCLIGPFVYGTDGTGGENLIVPTGGMRKAPVIDPVVIEDSDGNKKTINHLHMNGPEIFNFSLRVVPQTVKDLLKSSNRQIDEIDYFIFHQANSFMLEHLRKKTGIPSEKFCINMQDCGNTVSSTIPIALDKLSRDGKIRSGDLLMLVGFGVGYSWGGTLVRWIS